MKRLRGIRGQRSEIRERKTETLKSSNRAILDTGWGMAVRVNRRYLRKLLDHVRDCLAGDSAFLLMARAVIV